jgi:hypothetical protein
MRTSISTTSGELDDAVDRLVRRRSRRRPDVGLVLEYEPHAAAEQRVPVGEQGAYRCDGNAFTCTAGRFDQAERPSRRR